MRLVIVLLGAIWGIIACTSQSPTLLSTPTSSPVTLTVNDIDINFNTQAGWTAYTEERNIVLSNVSDPTQRLVINIWLPELELLPDETMIDVVEDIAAQLQDEPRIATSDLITTSWNAHEAVYFTLNNADERTAMILIVHVDEAIVAFNISGINSEFARARGTLQTLFSEFTVNEVLLGSDIFSTMPDIIAIPARNPEAALEGSSEPSDP